MTELLNWYSTRYDILSETLSDIRVLIALREHSDPAETLEKIKSRLEQTYKEVKELKDDKENS